MPYTSLNEHMFSMLDKTGTLALRLPTPAREAFLAKYTSKLVELYGMTMQEYIAVPDDLLARTGELKPFFDASFRYVGSLKPKATTWPKKHVATKTAKTGRQIRESCQTAEGFEVREACEVHENHEARKTLSARRLSPIDAWGCRYVEDLPAELWPGPIQLDRAATDGTFSTIQRAQSRLEGTHAAHAGKARDDPA